MTYSLPFDIDNSSKKPFICTSCGKQYTWFDGLTKHYWFKHHRT